LNTTEAEELLEVLLEAKKSAGTCSIFFDLESVKECALFKEKFLLVAKESGIYLVIEIEGTSLRLIFPDEERNQKVILEGEARQRAAEIEEINNETEMSVESFLEKFEEMVLSNSPKNMMERGLKAIKSVQKMKM